MRQPLLGALADEDQQASLLGRRPRATCRLARGPARVSIGGDRLPARELHLQAQQIGMSIGTEVPAISKLGTSKCTSPSDCQGLQHASIGVHPQGGRLTATKGPGCSRGRCLQVAVEMLQVITAANNIFEGGSLWLRSANPVQGTTAASGTERRRPNRMRERSRRGYCYRGCIGRPRKE